MTTLGQCIAGGLWGQGFYIHKKMIEYDIIIDEENKREELNDNAYVDDLYPFFIAHDELIQKIEKIFPNIKWKRYGESGFVKKNEAVIHFLITPSTYKNEVMRSLYAKVSFTDRPFDDLKDLCRAYGWNLFFESTLNYINIYEDNECEGDVFCISE